jgi:hypothetical protein
MQLLWSAIRSRQYWTSSDGHSCTSSTYFFSTIRRLLKINARLASNLIIHMQHSYSSLRTGSLLPCRHVNLCALQFFSTRLSLVELLRCATSTDSKIQCIHSFARYRIFLSYYNCSCAEIKMVRFRQQSSLQNACSKRHLETGWPFLSHIKRPAFRTWSLSSGRTKTSVQQCSS